MPDNKDYRLYLDERFNALNTLMNAHFINVKDTLDAIKKDTGLTNSRVTHLEFDLDELEKKTDKAIADGKHVIDTRVTECPNIKRFEKVELAMETLEKKLEDAMFFIRHPKIFMGIIVFFVMASIFTLYQTVHEAGILRDARFEMNSTKIEAQKINDAINEIQSRGIKLKKDTLNGINTH